MRKLFHSFALFAVIAALVAAGNMSTAPALQKDKDKAEVGKIEVFQDKEGGWRFRVVNDEGKSVAIATKGYEKKEECLEAIAFLKTTFAKAKVTEIKKDKKDKDK